MRFPVGIGALIVLSSVLGATAFAQPTEEDTAAARGHLEDALEATGDANDVLGEIAARSPKRAQLIRDAKRKARDDTDRSRGPAVIEGAARQAASLLGFGPLVDAIAGTGAAVATYAAGRVLGGRAEARRREDDDEDPDDRPRGGAAKKFREGDREHGGASSSETRDRGRADPPVNGARRSGDDHDVADLGKQASQRMRSAQ